MQAGNAKLVKSETRKPKSETRAMAAFGFRTSDFFRISGFGFRISLYPTVTLNGWLHWPTGASSTKKTAL